MKTLRLFWLLALFFLGMQFSSAQVNKSSNSGYFTAKLSSKVTDNKGTVSVQPTVLYDTLFSGNKSTQPLLLINGTNGAINYQTNAVWPDKSNRIRKYGDYADKSRKNATSKVLGKAKHSSLNPETKTVGDVLDTLLDVAYENCGMVIVGDTLFAIVNNSAIVVKYHLGPDTILGDFSVSFQPYSITFDGHYLWVAHDNGNVYAYTLNGTPTGYSFSTLNSDYSALTWDGEYFLYSYAWDGPNPTFYRCDETGTVVETINTTLPINVSQITWVPQHGSGHLWIVEEQTHTTYQIANDYSGIVYSFDNLFRDDYCYAILHDGKNILVGSWNDNFVLAFDDGVNETFITTVPALGNVASGDTALIQVKFNANGMNAGDYLNNLIINTDNANYPEFIVPAHLRVNGLPKIAVNPDSLGFELGYINYGITKDVVIKNTGSDVLQVSNITSSNPKFAISNNSFTINPKAQTEFTVTFTPTDTIAASGTLTVFSNDSTNPAIQIPMTGNAIAPPHIVVNPLSFTENMHSGDSVYKDLTIINTGTSELIFKINSEEVNKNKNVKTVINKSVNKPFSKGRKTNGKNTKKTERIISYVKNTADNKALDHILIYEDVPDFYFYTAALDSLGLSYTALSDWSDVSDSLTSGTVYDLVIINSYSNSPSSDELDALYNYAAAGGKLIYADWDVESYPSHPLMNYLGFSFISSIDEPKDFTATMPSHRIFNYPNQVTDFYWEDDQYSTDGQIGNVLSGATQLAAYNGYTSSGAIVLNTQKNCIFNAFQADNFDNDDNGNGIADVQELIENQISFFSSPIVFSQTSDTLAPGDTATVQTLFDAAKMIEGTYNYNILIENNDPSNQLVTIPVTLNITGDPEISIVNDTLNFGIVDLGFNKSMNLIINSSGTGTLHISSIIAADTNITTVNALNIPPKAQSEIAVNFLCADTGYF